VGGSSWNVGANAAPPTTSPPQNLNLHQEKSKTITDTRFEKRLTLIDKHAVKILEDDRWIVQKETAYYPKKS